MNLGNRSLKQVFEELGESGAAFKFSVVEGNALVSVDGFHKVLVKAVSR